MPELLNQGLLITLIGMGLVFVALLFLWGLMALMGRLPDFGSQAEEEAVAPEEIEPAEAGSPAADLRARAAAAAVCAALAMQPPAVRPESSSSQGLTPWQAAGRSAQLTQAARFPTQKSRGSSR